MPSRLALLSLAMVAGCAWTQTLQQLWPAGWWWIGCAAAAALVALLMPRHALYRWPRTMLAFLLACWCAASLSQWQAQRAIAQRLPSTQEGVERTVVVRIESMPRLGPGTSSFTARVLACDDGLPDCPTGLRARMSWTTAMQSWLARDEPDPASVFKRAGADSEIRTAQQPDLWAAQHWRFKLRFKRARSTFNPGLFDQEQRWLEDGIGALASVRPAHATLVGMASWRALGSWWEHGRQHLRTQVWERLDAWNWGSTQARGVVVALVLGDQAAIDAAWWERFNRTGLSHLMSISGLHITLLAGLARAGASLWWRARWGPRWRGQPLCLWCSAHHAGWIVAMLVAVGYSMLAGWGIPAQRTCLMLVIAACARLQYWPLSSAAILGVGAALVCLADPWAVLAPGFWLSFIGVACLMVSGETSTPGMPATDAWRTRMRYTVVWLIDQARVMVRTQWAVTIGLAPLCIVFFSSVSLVGPAINLVAIPLVSALITPLALVGLVGVSLGLPAGALLAACAAMVEPLLALVRWADALPIVVAVAPTPGPLALCMALMAVGLQLLTWLGAARYFALPGLLGLFANAGPTGVPDGHIRLDALDIGQGMAVLLQTPRFNLLYDTGPSMGPGQDAGQRVIVPWLRSRGVTTLHAMVVSHRDLDHSGGALSILQRMPVQWVASSLDATHPIVKASPKHYRCERGERWQWDAVEFEWLHPSVHDPAARRSASNAASCVLRVRFAGRTVLLAGDIEAPQERSLLDRFEDAALRADVLLAPHHGSATSSTPAFLDAVRPDMALFQVGYRNRYRHPSEKVLQRYRERGIRVLRTDASGAMRLQWSDDSTAITVQQSREYARRYWHLDWLDRP